MNPILTKPIQKSTLVGGAKTCLISKIRLNGQDSFCLVTLDAQVVILATILEVTLQPKKAAALLKTLDTPVKVSMPESFITFPVFLGGLTKAGLFAGVFGIRVDT